MRNSRIRNERIRLLARQPNLRGDHQRLGRNVDIPVCNTLAKIRELTLGLSLLASLVLLDSFLLEAFHAESVADHLFAGADGLVPAALGAVGVVLGDGARRGRGEGADLRGRVGRVVLGGGLVLVAVGLGL